MTVAGADARLASEAGESARLARPDTGPTWQDGTDGTALYRSICAEHGIAYEHRKRALDRTLNKSVCARWCAGVQQIASVPYTAFS